MNNDISTICSAIKPAVVNMPGYGAPPADAPVKLNQNESAFPLSDEIQRRICDRAMQSDWRRYPEDDPGELRRLLSEIHGYPADGFVFGNGSNEIILALWMACVQESAVVLTIEPTFTLYRLLSTVLGSRLEYVMLDDDFEFDGPALLAAVEKHHPKLIVLASPNNPTGTCLPLDVLEQLLQTTDGMLALDEAYIDYTENPRGGLPLIERYPNLVVFRTFSKSMSAAGLRLGYGIADPAVAREINKVRLPFNMDWFSRAAAATLLESRDIMIQNVQETMRQREQLFDAMSKISGIKVIPSQANFLLFECQSKSAQQVYDGLLEQGILIRNISSYPKLGRGLRVSVGQESENRQFLDALTQMMEGDG
jgi:histidinol-phosphate aminotransferase